MPNEIKDRIISINKILNDDLKVQCTSNLAPTLNNISCSRIYSLFNDIEELLENGDEQLEKFKNKFNVNKKISDDEIKKIYNRDELVKLINDTKSDVNNRKCCKMIY